MPPKKVIMYCVLVCFLSLVSASVRLSWQVKTFELRGGADVEDDKTSGGIQYMITNRMRRVLIESLGYLPDEVDCMDPQVAAVVIERGLSRPSKGMPLSWKQNRQEENQVKSLALFLQKKWGDLTGSVRESVAWVTGDRTILVSVGPLLALVALFVFKSQVTTAGHVIAQTVTTILKAFFTAPLHYAKKLSKKAKRQPVNVQYLEDLTRGGSWTESAARRFNDIRRKFQ